jgi:hypothetical protein
LVSCPESAADSEKTKDKTYELTLEEEKISLKRIK